MIALRHHGLMVLAVMLMAPAMGSAETLYKYQNDDGVWSYSDRPPDNVDDVELIELDGTVPRPTIKMVERRRPDGVDLVVINTYRMPMEVVLQFVEADNVSVDVGTVIQHVAAASSTELVEQVLASQPGNWALAYDARFIPGDPRNIHRPATPYRAPFAAANSYPVTQAYPSLVTHNDDGNRYAIDIAMPEGTPVYAARSGIVVEIENRNFSTGTNLASDGPNANIVRVFHDDGSMAVYAHLKWDAIRVQVGDRIEEGEYIADSGNTGFSTGPHLHFNVQLNRENHLISVPFAFRDATGAPITPQAGQALQAHP